ncbi:glycosyltransferase [Candidatus Omnitrophota bacterium]
MNILHLLSRFDSYDAIAGALDLTTHLVDKNHNSIVASSLDSQIFQSHKPDIKHYSLPLFETNVKNYFAAYKKLKEIIKINKIDVVHAHSALGGWLAFLSCRHTDKPLVNTCYDFYSKNIFNYSLILGKKVIVHNEAMGQHLINNFNLPRERLCFIKQSLDLDNFDFQDVDQRSKTDFKIGMISPSHQSKEYEYFLKAMVKVVRIMPHVRIWIISYRAEFKQNIKEELKLWVRRLGLNNYVKFFDTSSLNLKFMIELNLLMFSAFQEEASIRPILEAQAYGVPVIATRVAGVAEIIIDNKTGILVPPQDNNNLANVMIKTLKDYSLSREIVVSARNRIERDFNLDKNTIKFVDTYKELKGSLKILAINTGKAQDVISSIPALKVIKEKVPGGQIASLVNPSSRCLLRCCPYIDELIIFDRNSKYKGFVGFMRILRLLIEQRFDLILDFNNSFKTNLLSYLSLANKRCGYNNTIIAKFLINKGTKRPIKSMGLLKDKLAILEPLGIEAKDYNLELWPSQEDAEFADNFLKDSWVGKEKIIGMDISVKRGLFNDLRTLDYLAYLCDKLANQQMRVILIGSRGDHNIKKELFKRIKSKPILPSGDISAIQLASLIKKCDIYISLSQETLYMALAMKIPSIILSGAKNNFDLSKYKNVQVLSNKDIGINMMTRNRKRIKYKDNVIEAINRLIQVK